MDPPLSNLLDASISSGFGFGFGCDGTTVLATVPANAPPGAGIFTVVIGSQSATTTFTVIAPAPTPTATTPPPAHNFAPRFYGQQDVVIGHSAAQAIGQAMQNYTVELSAHPDATQQANAAIIDAHTGGSGWTLKQAGTAVNQYTWSVFTSNSSAQTQAFTIPAGGWHHVAITYRGASRTVTVFVDGRQVASQAAFPDPSPPLGSMFFARGTGGGGYWKGMLQYIRFSNVVRYPAGVASVPSGAAGFADRGHAAAFFYGPEAQIVTFAPPLGPFAPDPAAIAVWNLDEGSGTTAVDVSTNHFSGSFEGYLQEAVWVDRVTGLPPATASGPASATGIAPTSRPGQTAPAVTRPSSLPATGGGGVALLPWVALLLLATSAFVALFVRLRRLVR